MRSSDTLFLQASNISCVRGEQRLFDNLNFSLSAGDVLQVIGVNGAGKSSLLRLIAGLLLPDLGALDCRVDSFFLGHQLGLKKAFTLEENLYYDFRYEKPTLPQIKSLLKDNHLLSFLKRKTADLSRGQQQKLALIKCLLSPAKLWVLDEPLTGLDSASQEYWQDKIADHAQLGGAVVMSTHYPLSLSNVSCKQLELSSC